MASILEENILNDLLYSSPIEAMDIAFIILAQNQNESEDAKVISRHIINTFALYFDDNYDYLSKNLEFLSNVAAIFVDTDQASYNKVCYCIKQLLRNQTVNNQKNN